MSYFFTSDWHDGHKRLLEFGHRPFKTIEEMRRVLIKRWNNRVKETDTVFILGDFNFGGVKERNKLFKKLNGYKILIKGNHDPNYLLLGGYVEMLGKGWELVHNPEDSSAMNVIHGHIHLPKAVRVHRQKNGRLFVNVNVELWDYAPVSIKQIKKEIERDNKK